ncbi:MAG: hypothetical protein EAZ15_03300 [Sphingobacteriales bacterium]|nr:MAG: hypothetical protein EAZ15_03300 [Sphingobacteriales bacterium]
METNPKVIIVGACTAGLMLAAQLLRFGVHPLIIDGKTNHNTAKLLYLNSKSLEVYQQMRIAEQALANGKKISFLNLNQKGKPLANLPFGDFGVDKTQFPFIHILDQNTNNQLLINYLTTHCCPIYWDTDLVNIEKDTDGVKIIVNHRGEIKTWYCTYLIDGDSSVRRLLNIEFNGATSPKKYYIADFKLTNFNIQKGANFYISKKDFVAIFPLKTENTFRVTGKIPKQIAAKKNITFVDVQPHIQLIINKNLDIEKCTEFFTYQLQHKIASNYSIDNCFFIGHAAHTLSPTSNIGINTSLQNAYNLGWKLAGVLNQQLHPKILKSYAIERIPVAKKMLKTADRAFTFLASQNVFIMALRYFALKHLINWFSINKKLSAKLFNTVSYTGINYRNSKINLHLSTSTKIKAGDRVPYLPIFDEKTKQQTNLHNWCSGNSFVLLILGYLTPPNLFSLAKWIKTNYNLTFNYLPATTANKNIFDAFEIVTGERKMIVIRPDLHISLISDVVDTTILDNYLRNVLGMIK